MTRISNSTVLITGGASGIGKLMGQKCLQQGASRLVIWDINPENLQLVAAEFEAQGYQVHPYLVDIGNLAEVERTADRVLREAGTPSILINNAGIVVGKRFAEHSLFEIERTLNINVLGAMAATRVFLPAMLQQGHGHVVNIASAASLLPNPRMSVYAASKWAVLGWSESLRLELEQMSPHLHVTTVTPSYIDTGMFAGVKAPLLTPILQPETIANAILEAVKENKIILRKPFIVNLLPLLRGILPTRIFDAVVGKTFKVYTSMDKFSGRPGPVAVPEKRATDTLTP
ncbi:SDR family oxidoreductase [Pontibacter ruber]|uniref:SDR family oxidoreductase n=1 Tax=Pontibacter ruber TaxID=1343895 RepID=A0ABW5D158_9BACT|nr:SDR family oxidoreductase [Pontibacter ruber]